MWGRLVLAVGLVAAVAATSGPLVAEAGGTGPRRRVALPAHRMSFAAQRDDGRAAEPLLDLAAMVPGPADLADDGYGVSYAESRTLTGYATDLNSLAGGREADVADLVEGLEEAGWRQAYQVWLSLPSEDDPDFFGRNITILLVEYADDEGAEAGYDLVTESNAAGGLDEADGGDAIGDQSALYRTSGTNSNGDRFRWLGLVFQTGPIVAQVSIVDFTNDSPPASEAAALGTDLEERIAAVVEDGAPGFGPALLRVDAEGMAIYWDWYRRLDGETRRNYNETVSTYESNVELHDEIGLVDYYVFLQDLPAEDADDPVYSYYAELMRFEDEDAASAYVEDWPQQFVEDPTTGYSNVEFVDDAEPFGDESTVVSFDNERVDGSEASGFSAYVRTEERVVFLALSGVPSVPLAAIEALVEGQLACLEDGACEGWEPMPEELGGPGARDADDEGDEGDEEPAEDEEPADGEEEAVEVTLGEVDDSGVRGTATLAPDEDETEATVELRGGEEGMVVAVHGGTCDDLDPEPVSGPEAVDEEGAATLAVPVALDELLEEEHAVAVYASERDLGDDPLACGEVEP